MSAVLEMNLPVAEVCEFTPVHEDSLYEIVDGERVEQLEMSVYAHQIASRLFFLLKLWSLQSRLGDPVIETLLILNADSDLRRRPDVAWVSFQTWPADREIPPTGDWEVVPDVAIEVVSPNDVFNQVMRKMHEYFEHGVTEVWVVVPDEQELYRYRSPLDVTIIPSNGVLNGDALLPGFQLNMSELLARTFAVSVGQP